MEVKNTFDLLGTIDASGLGYPGNTGPGAGQHGSGKIF